MKLSKHELNALEYRVRAEAAAKAAEACELARAREQHQIAAAKWAELADAAERRVLEARSRVEAASADAPPVRDPAS